MAKYIPVLASEARTGSSTTPTFNNYDGGPAIHLVVDVTSGANLTVTLQGYDFESAKNYTLLSYVAPAGTTVLKLGPDYTAGGAVAKDYLPAAWNVYTSCSGSTTYSIGASVI